MIKHCRGICKQCDYYAVYAGLLFATFRCLSCGQLVGWCEGGTSSEADPRGDRCARCWVLYDQAIQRAEARIDGRPSCIPNCQGPGA